MLQLQRDVVRLAHRHVAGQYDLDLNVVPRPEVVRPRDVHLRSRRNISRNWLPVSQPGTAWVPLHGRKGNNNVAGAVLSAMFGNIMNHWWLRTQSALQP